MVMMICVYTIEKGKYIMIPCTECLKLPICKSKEKVRCEDLMAWLRVRTDIECAGDRIIEFETFWGKEISCILNTSLLIEFKKKKDNYSCMIVKNM
jgi:hypothetical protein